MAPATACALPPLLAPACSARHAASLHAPAHVPRGCCSRPAALLSARAAVCRRLEAMRARAAPRRWLRRLRRVAAPAAQLDPSAVLAAALSSSPGLAVGTAVNAAVFMAGLRVLLRGLTPAGVAHAAVLGSLVYSAFGAGGYALLCVYFLAGSAVTKLRLAQKQAEGIAEARSGRRSPASVWGSGAAGAACAAAALAGLPPGAALWRMAFVASVASKLGDTTSSEVGKAYGRTTYLITTLQLVPRGTEGAVSVEGTAAGVAAAAALASLAFALGQVDAAGWLACVGAAFAANTAESVLGASLQGRVTWLSNDIVNVLQIVLAAALALLFRTLA